jgi:hypothetical protein
MKSSYFPAIGGLFLALLGSPAKAEDAAVTQFNRAYQACVQALQQCNAKCKKDAACVEACAEKEMDCIEAAERKYQQNCERPEK